MQILQNYSVPVAPQVLLPDQTARGPLVVALSVFLNQFGRSVGLEGSLDAERLDPSCRKAGGTQEEKILEILLKKLSRTDACNLLHAETSKQERELGCRVVAVAKAAETGGREGFAGFRNSFLLHGAYLKIIVGPAAIFPSFVLLQTLARRY